ncbi:MAG: HAD family hydrolase [Planctomycetota bacterium]|nr:MAG: HAD family hydrolase [Planctomycetota bacterium]
MRYQVIIFDIGDIFFDASIWRKWLTEYLQNLGVTIDYPSLCRKWEIKLVDVYLGKQKYWDRFKEFLGEFGLDDASIERTIAASQQKAREVEDRNLFDGVAETLSELKRMGLKLAILSDTESHEPHVRQRLAELNIEQYFDAVVTSVDINHIKPQPEAYAAVLKRLGGEINATIFVGHDADELQGAMDFGLTAVAYNYREKVLATHYIKRFKELLEIIR